MSEIADRRLRILHLILVVGETNGQYNEHCLPLADRRDIAICSYFPPQLVPPSAIEMFAGDGTLRGFFRALRRALDANDFDIVHAHAPHTGVLLALGLLRWGRFRMLRRSLVYTVQDSFYDYKPRNQLMTVLSLAAFGRIVFCSRAAYDSLPRVWKLLVRGRWRVVQNGADLDRIDRALASGPPRGAAEGASVVSVGRLDRVKDPLGVVEAFARASSHGDRLIVAGAGPLERAIEQRGEELAIAERIHMLGLVPRDEVYRACAAADVFVSASRGEGLPVAVMEAMATGCPVILSDIPPHREVADGASFIPIVPVGDVEGFARELRRLLDMSSTGRREVGRRCREHVAARFTLDTMHDALAAVYAEVAGFREPAAAR